MRQTDNKIKTLIKDWAEKVDSFDKFSIELEILPNQTKRDQKKQDSWNRDFSKTSEKLSGTS